MSEGSPPTVADTATGSTGGTDAVRPPPTRRQKVGRAVALTFAVAAAALYWWGGWNGSSRLLGDRRGDRRVRAGDPTRGRCGSVARRRRRCGGQPTVRCGRLGRVRHRRGCRRVHHERLRAQPAARPLHTARARRSGSGARPPASPRRAVHDGVLQRGRGSPRFGLSSASGVTTPPSPPTLAPHPDGRPSSTSLSERGGSRRWLALCCTWRPGSRPRRSTARSG